jgi:hypothetical protein
MADPIAAAAHKFRDSDISLREYVDTRVASTVEARQEAVTDLRELFQEKLTGLGAVLQADMATLRATIDERDKLYNERSTTGKTAVDAALKSAETAVNAAFAAAEKAGAKSDVNAEKWRENANEWRAAMMDRESKFAQKAELDTELKSLRTELASLRETRAGHDGASKQQTDNRAVLASLGALIILIMLLITFFTRGDPPAAPTSTQPQIIYVPAPAGSLLPTTPPQPAPR